ncbi:MAG: hypothetical protein WC333_06590 [Dehalococcoidia bacterium]|jgi:hypothetical protein
MIGLKFEQLCLEFDSSFSGSVALMREDEKKLEEILGVHKDEFPKVKEHFDRMSKEFESWNLSTDDLIVVSYLTLLKVIEINNMTISEQLAKANILI